MKERPNIARFLPGRAEHGEGARVSILLPDGTEVVAPFDLQHAVAAVAELAGHVHEAMVTRERAAALRRQL